MIDIGNKKKETWVVFGSAFLLWLLELFIFADTGTRGLVFCCGLVSVALLLMRDLKPMWNVSTLLLMGYVVFAGFGGIYAMSGKFFLREYTKLFVAAGVFLYVLLKPKFDRAFVRRVMMVIAAVSALVAFLSVEIVTSGLFRAVESQFPVLSTLTIGYTERLYGIYGNSNVEASVYAVGILTSLACLAEAQDKKNRVISVVLCSLNAFAFLLCISVGATMCLALAVVVYLIAAGKERVKVLLRMLMVAVPTMVFVVLSAGMFNRSGVLHVLPLLLMAVNAAVSVFLELTVMEKVTWVMEKRAKLPFVIMLAMVGLVAVYLVAAVNLTSAYTFTQQDERLWRADYTSAGTHTLSVEADGKVTVYIGSQTRYDILQNHYPKVYEGAVDGDVTFTVPEDSAVCVYWFYAEPGTKITSATIDGTTSIPLKYTILPSFVADRLQGAWTSSSLVIRQALWDYGMRLFRMSPVIGNGYGAYESGLMRVEDFVFETKYVHNHYIQVLLESGVIGFALYVGALLSMAVTLVKKRRFVEDAECGWAYPVLAAIFVMVCTVTLWDISMSRIIYLGLVYAVFALLIRLLASPLPVKQREKKAVSKKELALQVQKDQTRKWVIGCVCALFPALFLVSLAGNMAGQSLLNRPISEPSEYFENAKQAAMIDPYEYNDAKLSFVVVAGDQEAEEYYDQANQFAEELMQVQSNSIPYYLAKYYINTRQYVKAMEAAERSAIYCAASPDTWNSMFSVLWTGVVLNDDALLKDFDTLYPLVMAYRDGFDARNAKSIGVITLEEPAKSCYEMLGELRENEESSRQEAIDYLNLILEDYYKVLDEMMAEQNASAG